MQKLYDADRAYLEGVEGVFFGGDGKEHGMIQW